MFCESTSTYGNSRWTHLFSRQPQLRPNKCKRSSSFQQKIDPNIVSDALLWDRQKSHFEQILAKINVVSFNLLCPSYKSIVVPESKVSILPIKMRESSQKSMWVDRALKSVDFFEKHILQNSQIIGLQEFWLDDYYQSLFRAKADEYGFQVCTLRRAGARSDAIGFMIHNSLQIISSKDCHLCFINDRVALILWLRHIATDRDLIVANTHLSFPHSDYDRLNQVKQIQTLTAAVDHFARQHRIETATRIVLGDFNVVSESAVCQHLRAVGYTSSFDVCPPTAPNGYAMAPGNYVTHRNHRSEELGVDHIFFRPEIELPDVSGRNKTNQKTLVTTRPSSEKVDIRPSSGLTGTVPDGSAGGGAGGEGGFTPFSLLEMAAAKFKLTRGVPLTTVLSDLYSNDSDVENSLLDNYMTGSGKELVSDDLSTPVQSEPQLQPGSPSAALQPQAQAQAQLPGRLLSYLQRQRRGVFVDRTSVMPLGLDFSTWNESFTISDHRPVFASLVVAERAAPKDAPVAPDGVEAGSGAAEMTARPLAKRRSSV